MTFSITYNNKGEDDHGVKDYAYVASNLIHSIINFLLVFIALVLRRLLSWLSHPVNQLLGVDTDSDGCSNEQNWHYSHDHNVKDWHVDWSTEAACGNTEYDQYNREHQVADAECVSGWEDNEKYDSTDQRSNSNEKFKHVQDHPDTV